MVKLTYDVTAYSYLGLTEKRQKFLMAWMRSQGLNPKDTRYLQVDTRKRTATVHTYVRDAEGNIMLEHRPGKPDTGRARTTQHTVRITRLPPVPPADAGPVARLMYKWGATPK